MANYFKDKKFRLLYLDVEGGIPVSLIPRVITEDSTDDSMVIAARGGPLNFHSYLNPGRKIAVKFSEEKSEQDKYFKEIYDHICASKELERTKFFQLNASVAEEIVDRVKALEDERVNRLIVLAHHDGQPVEKPKDTEFLCFEVKEGGPELVLEFLLSTFCNSFDTEWVRRDDPNVRYEPPEDFAFRLGGLTDEEKLEYKEVPVYDFTLSANLDALVEYEEDFDDDGDSFYRSSGYFYYYSVNLKALSRLTEKIDIPWRVREILTPEQIVKLDAEVPGIFMADLDYIARSVLMQKVDSYVADRARQYERMRAQQWASDMYDVLGGDGEGNVYMSDGMSLTADGRIVDD
jgi:hypothetical protein